MQSRTPGGRSTHQRAAIRMTPTEVDDFLRETRTLTLCTMNPDGTIHAVPMWYALIEGAPVVQTKAKSQKVRNLLRDPRVTCLVEAGVGYAELRGVELVGRGEVTEDPSRLWAVGTSVYDRYVGPYTEAHREEVDVMLRKRVAITVHVDRVVSWDHRKLPGARPG